MTSSDFLLVSALQLCTAGISVGWSWTLGALAVGWLVAAVVGWLIGWSLGALALPLLCKSAGHLCSYTASLDLDIVDTTEFLRIPGLLKN